MPPPALAGFRFPLRTYTYCTGTFTLTYLLRTHFVIEQHSILRHALRFRIHVPKYKLIRRLSTSVTPGHRALAFSPLLHVRIKQSKTDPFRQGCVIRVASTGNAFCPVAAVVAYIQAHPWRSGPLFVLSDGSFLTRAHIQVVLRDNFPFARPETIGTHSFRIGGGATVLCCLGVPAFTIQILGRWSSGAFRRYLRISDEFLADVHHRAARHRTTFSRIWIADAGFSVPYYPPR